jgi:hypothetical protein
MHDIVPPRLIARLEEAKRFQAYLDERERLLGAPIEAFFVKVWGYGEADEEVEITDFEMTRDQLIRAHLDAWDSEHPVITGDERPHHVDHVCGSRNRRTGWLCERGAGHDGNHWTVGPGGTERFDWSADG